MKTKILTILIFLSLQACVTYHNPIPVGYEGPKAKITDTVVNSGGSKAALFYVRSVDEGKVYNAYDATAAANYGKGPFRVAPVPTSRMVMVGERSIDIVGQIYNAAPIGAILNAGKNYRVDGQVRLLAKEGEDYFIKGRLSDDYSAVWVENINGVIVSELVEVMNKDVEKSAKTKEMIFQEKENRLTPETKNEIFLTIEYGETSDLIISRFGTPVSKTLNDTNIFTDRPPYTTFVYENLGSIVFKGKLPNLLYVEKVIPNPIVDPSRVNELARILDISKGRNLQYLATSYYRAEVKSEEILDVIAKKIWKEKLSSDEYVIDSMSWFCRVLSQSNNSRYKGILKAISEKAGDKKLRKHALQNFKKLPQSNKSQFEIDFK